MIDYALELIEPLSMLDLPQLEFLVHLANKAPDGTAVECGVWCGGSVIAWESVRRGRGSAYAVDDFSGAQGQSGYALQAVCLENFIKWGTKAEIIMDSSWDVPYTPIDLPIAFCFIDANHGIHGIPHDIVAWPRAMMPGGILVFHDYDVSNPRVVVKCIVDAWQYEAQWEDLGLVGSTKAYRKPDADDN